MIMELHDHQHLHSTLTGVQGTVPSRGPLKSSLNTCPRRGATKLTSQHVARPHAAVHRKTCARMCVLCNAKDALNLANTTQNWEL